MRLDHEINVACDELVGENSPCRRLEQKAEMWNRYIIAIYLIRDAIRLGFNKVSHDLMPIQIEIDPLIARPTLVAAKNLAIKVAGIDEAVDGKRKVESGAVVGHEHSLVDVAAICLLLQGF